jgi:hypothetical protein
LIQKSGLGHFHVFAHETKIAKVKAMGKDFNANMILASKKISVDRKMPFQIEQRLLDTNGGKQMSYV